MGYEKDRLTGQTVEEKDSLKYRAQVANLKEYKRQRRGLPSSDVIIDGHVIPPISSLHDGGAADTAQREYASMLSLETSHPYHIRMVREEILAAQGMGEPKEVVEELKRAA